MIEIITIILVAITLLLWLSGKKNNPIEQEAITEASTKNYRAVKLIPCSASCESAKWVSEKVFLEKDLSHLPLESCDKADQCKCKLKHYKERRQHEERRIDSAILQDAFNGSEHRIKKKRGRRKDD